MYKRGQVTIFVIIALIVVAGIGIGSYILTSQKASESPENKDISDYVDSCLQDVSREAVVIIGEQGGYNGVPNESTDFLFYPKPFYIYGEENLVPGKNILENEISKYIAENIDYCLSDFSSLKQKGFDIKKGKNSITAKIIRDEVQIEAQIPLSITKDNSTSLLNDFSAVVKPVRFDILLEVSSNISASETKDPRKMCITCIQNIAEANGLKIDILQTDNTNDFIYILTDDKSNFRGEPYEYGFAARYKFPNCKSVEECANVLS